MTEIIRQRRPCDGCTLCCKVLEIPALSKPGGTWCVHCKAGVGCGVYEQRPGACAEFECGYIVGFTPDNWKPDKCKMVVVFEAGANRLVVHVDPGLPNAWRKEPFYGQIKKWAMAAQRREGSVVVAVDDRMTVVFPEREVHLGVVPPGKVIAWGRRMTQSGPEDFAHIADPE